MDLRLSLSLTDTDLAALLARHESSFRPLTDLSGKVTPAGLVVSGSYPAVFLSASVSTTWRPIVARQQVRLRLDDVRVVGVPLPGPVVRGKILAAIAEGVAGAVGVSVEGDEVVLDMGKMLGWLGLDVSGWRVRGVSLEAGKVTLEA